MNGETFFIGCDMGGWHNKSRKKGDALAVCKWDGAKLHHIVATADITFFPVNREQQLACCLRQATSDDVEIIVCIDAALSWPERFSLLTREAFSFQHDFNFELKDSINNPYLYRETERFIKRHVQTGKKERPLAAVGDRFGNNSSKAQALAAWFHNQMPEAYCPPFNKWDPTTAKDALNTIIEVYPAASMRSSAFRKLKWPEQKESMANAGNTDIADAKRCAMTGFVYAASIGKLDCGDCPQILTPDDATDGEIKKSALETEGWIFAPSTNDSHVE